MRNLKITITFELPASEEFAISRGRTRAERREEVRAFIEKAYQDAVEPKLDEFHAQTKRMVDLLLKKGETA